MIDTIKDSIRYNTELWIIGFLVLAIVGLAWLAIAAAIAEEEQWQAFSAEHDCVKVGHVAGDTHTGVGYGMTANGQFGTIVTTSTTPDKTGWKCDDGVTYWR